MTPFTDEQLLEAAIVFAVEDLHVKPFTKGVSRDAIRRYATTGMTDTEKTNAIEAMRAALQTLGLISVHRPVTRYAVSWLYVLWETPEDDDDYEEITVCDACYKAQKEALDIYAIDDYRSAVWPCPVAQAHEKENHA